MFILVRALLPPGIFNQTPLTPLHPQYLEIFRELKQRLANCGRRGTEPLWTCLVQRTFAQSYCDRLPLPAVRLSPVEYYKENLALFEAELEYYGLRYECERCQPNEKDPKWAGFWTRELGRLTKLTRAHGKLYAYFLARRTDRDHEFFGGDPLVAERNTHLYASFIALTRYEKELEKQFEKRVAIASGTVNR